MTESSSDAVPVVPGVAAIERAKSPIPPPKPTAKPKHDEAAAHDKTPVPPPKPPKSSDSTLVAPVDDKHAAPVPVPKPAPRPRAPASPATARALKAPVPAAQQTPAEALPEPTEPAIIAKAEPTASQEKPVADAAPTSQESAVNEPLADNSLPNPEAKAADEHAISDTSPPRADLGSVLSVGTPPAGLESPAKTVKEEAKPEVCVLAMLLFNASDVALEVWVLWGVQQAAGNVVYIFCSVSSSFNRRAGQSRWI